MVNGAEIKNGAQLLPVSTQNLTKPIFDFGRQQRWSSTSIRRSSTKLRLAISGPSGSGKTYTMLKIASDLGGRIALVDTEHGSASKYADLFEFDVLELDSYDPGHFAQDHRSGRRGRLPGLVHRFTLPLLDGQRRGTRNGRSRGPPDAEPEQLRRLETSYSDP
jgi:hypothetical protein